ncbi:hypothetical protein PV394_16210 [Streptomyces sp. NE06-03E]|uniref:hypothetical protein n=1 Tax=Streptomyces sp. NE06-03E TaxID=3028695 RepID=UPI0029A46C61|nr:hypothetical protein [Streptomyces sp. NE06-03E]MDX3056672.1 hypothetical protein [Streptomyces sp. NE06-03E]
MSLPPLATPAQLAEWMQIPEDSLPASASTVLETASAIIRREARQNFARTTSTYTLYPLPINGRWGYAADIPTRPVVSVDDVTVDGVPVAYGLRRDRLFVGTCAPLSVTVTYGYGGVPGDVLAVALTAAQRVLSNPGDLRQETVGSMSMTYAAETIGVSLSPADKDLLADYRRRALMVRLT